MVLRRGGALLQGAEQSAAELPGPRVPRVVGSEDDQVCCGDFQFLHQGLDFCGGQVGELPRVPQQYAAVDGGAPLPLLP